MPILQEPTESDGPIPEDTIVAGEVLGVVEKEKTNNVTGEKYTRVDFRFQINDPESPFDGRTIYGETSDKFVRHPECRLYAWSQEILGQELPADYDLDYDQLVGHSVRMVIGLRLYGENNSKTYNFVADVMRNRQTAASSAF